MSTAIDARELHAHLREYLERAAHGEEILVRHHAGGRRVLVRLSVAPSAGAPSPDAPSASPRRRFASERSIAEVLAEDRGA